MELIKANKRLFDAIVALHPKLCMSVEKEEELYLAMQKAKEATNNHQQQVNVSLANVSGRLNINYFVDVLKRALEGNDNVKVEFDNENDNINYVLDVCSNFKKELEKDCC